MNKDSKQRRNDRKEMEDMVLRKPEHVSENAKKWFMEKPYQLKIQEERKKNE